MKIIYLISLLCFLIQIKLSANDSCSSLDCKDSVAFQQNEPEELLSSWGRRVYYQDTLLSNQEVLDIYKDYPEISELYSKGYTLAKVGQPLLIAGIVGTSTGSILLGLGIFGDWVYPDSDIIQLSTIGAFIGIVCVQMIPVAIVLKITGMNYIAGSVRRYNQSQIKSSGKTKFEYSFGIVSSGLGFQVRF